MQNNVATDLAERYIRGTEKEAIVQNVQALLCEITVATMRGITAVARKVYISTRMIKHLYDKRPAEEFDFVVYNIHLIARYPDAIYRNKDPKRGDFFFTKSIKNKKYFCSLQHINVPVTGDSQFEIVTAFRIQKDSYLLSYDLLWEWKGGKPSS